MDIEKVFNRNKVFRNNLGTFDLQLCRWKGITTNYSTKKQIFNLETKGFIHAAAQIKDTIYLIIGPDQNNTTQTMHSFNFRSCQWKQWNDCNLPQNRDSFALITHLNQLYLFGGSNEGQLFGDTYTYSTFSSTWRQLEGQHPKPRNPMIFTDVEGFYILLFGGLDVTNGEILDDAYILVEGIWKVLVIINSPGRIIGAKAAVCGQKIYLYGGQIHPTRGQPFNNKNIYQLIIDQQNVRLQFWQVPLVKSNISPCPRTSHCMIGINRQNFILLGGISLEGARQDQILKDLWLFNSEQSNWLRVDPMNGILRGFCDSSLSLYNNKIYIIGGRTETLETWNQQISLIQFGQDETIRNEICSSCQQRAITKQKEQKSFPKPLVISVGFLFNLALQIKHPFQAISIIRQCAGMMKATKFTCCLSKGIHENEFIQMQWDGNSLSKSQFEQLICHSTNKNPQFSKFVNMLKIASLRLGKTLLFINNDTKTRKVFILSADSKVCPQFDENYTYFGYLQNIEKKIIQSHEGRSHQKIITNILKSRLNNPYQYLNKNNINSLLIFDKNILVTSQKTYYYQLIASSQDDLTVFKNNKKIQFLEQIGYSLYQEPQLSLRTYLALSSLDNKTPYPYINSQIPVQPINYLQLLKDMENKGIISQINIPQNSTQEVQFDAWMYKCQKKKVLNNNFGILVYYENQLVNRLDTNFGDFLKEQFYKTKYKSPQTIFTTLGIINIKKGIHLNYFSTWFNKTKAYYQLIDTIKLAIKRAKSQRIEQQNKMIDQEHEQRKQAKLK